MSVENKGGYQGRNMQGRNHRNSYRNSHSNKYKSQNRSGVGATQGSKSYQRLGLWMLIALVTGNMIGSGIFLLPASLAQLGSVSLYSWVLTTVGSLVLALVFARMSLLIPKTGGPYAYAKAGFGSFIGFQTAYHYWAALWFGNAAIALALIGYLRVFFPILNSSEATTVGAIAFVWVLTLVNIIGIGRAGFLQLLTTIVKLIPLVLIILFGWAYFHLDYLKQPYFNLSNTSDWVAISHGASLTLWAFIGLEAATVPSGSVENPKRNIPLATLIGTGIGALVYILSSLVIMGMINPITLAKSTSPFADAAGIIFGHWGLMLIAIGAIVSCFGALNGWIMLQGQVAMAAAEDGLFPKIFAKKNHYDTPYLGQIISSLLITGLLLLQMSNNLISQFNLFILLAVFASVLPYLYTAVAQWRICSSLARTVPQQEDQSYKNTWKYKWDLLIALLAVVYSLWAIMSTGTEVLIDGMGLLLSSIVLYGLIRKFKSSDE